MDRHGRQSRLTEIGASGQGRIGRADAAVPLDGLAGEVAARYLAGAGVSRLRVKSDAAARAAHAVDPGVLVEVDTTLRDAMGASPFGLRDRAADDVARGAHAALVELRRALGMTP
jgi:hypothetical protein